MRNRMYGGVRGRKTKVGEKLHRFPPTRLSISLPLILRLRVAPNRFQSSPNHLTMFFEPFIELLSLRSS